MTYFNLFSTVFITRGASRILVSDLQRDFSELLPLEFADLLEDLKKYSVQEVLDLYDCDSKPIVEEYLDLLINKEYGFFTQNNWDNNFPALSYEYDDANTISNIFIELKNISVLEKIVSSIEKLATQHLVIYTKNNLLLKDFIKIDEYFKTSVLNTVEIISPYHHKINTKFLEYINESTERICNITFYNCPRLFSIKSKEFSFEFSFFEESIEINSCGKVSLKYFNTNITKILEAVNYNSCLYKKIGIDEHGNIKNCPAMSQSFGNINDMPLEKAIANTKFKRYWYLTKDGIESCKNCEFRYVCTDCRAYTEITHANKEGLDVSKPLKCGYDPYTGEWEEWSTNPLKQKAISFYGMQEIAKKK